MAETPKNQNKSKRDRNWCYTVNNYSDDDIDLLTALADKCTYLIFGKEVGEQGTPHLQGYLHYKHPQQFDRVKKDLPAGCHIEPMIKYSTPEKAAAYCKKEKNFTEFGTCPMSQEEKGKRGREFWELVKENAKKGKFDDIDPKVYLQYYRTIKNIHADHGDMPPDLEESTNYWYYGNTGTGKSYKARSENPGAYLKMCNKWWDNYQGQEIVIIEDFDKNHSVLGHHLKIWGDRYAFPAEVKGSKVNLRPKCIIVTSNYSPNEIWGSEPGTLGPIQRRFTIKHFPDLNRPNYYLSP